MKISNRHFFDVALKKSGVCHIRAEGSSMLPIIHNDDLLEIVEAAPGLLFPGQVIIYEVNGELISHRIIYETPIGYLTGGDSNIALDNPVLPNQIIGVVVSVANKDGIKTVLSGSHNSFNIEGRKNKREIREISIYLPCNYYQPLKTLFENHDRLKIYCLEDYSADQMAHSYGVSPYGLMNEQIFATEIRKKDYVNLICLADFGPRSKAECFPVNKVKGVFRPEYFHRFRLLDVNTSLVGLLSYLDGFIKAIPL